MQTAVQKQCLLKNAAKAAAVGNRRRGVLAAYNR